MSAPLLQAQGIAVGYGTGAPVVRDVDLEVGEGELVALLGANGAGKTTTLLGLSGQLELSAGSVSMYGTETTLPLHRRIQDGLAFVAEDRSVFMSLTGSENFRVAGADRGHALELFPELGDHLGRRVGLLSGGQQQMLAVALALGRRPRILIADELSLGLAPMIVDRLVAALRQAAEQHGVGVLLVEQHVGKAISGTDRAYVMRRGEIVMSGSSSELQGRLSEVEASYLAEGTG
jgi:branched-chain amino acid transport system ATP-binding protein